LIDKPNIKKWPAVELNPFEIVVPLPKAQVSRKTPAAKKRPDAARVRYADEQVVNESVVASTAPLRQVAPDMTQERDTSATQGASRSVATTKSSAPPSDKDMRAANDKKKSCKQPKPAAPAIGQTKNATVQQTSRPPGNAALAGDKEASSNKPPNPTTGKGQVKRDKSGTDKAATSTDGLECVRVHDVEDYHVQAVYPGVKRMRYVELTDDMLPIKIFYHTNNRVYFGQG